jgi:hypothetical protein
VSELLTLAVLGLGLLSIWRFLRSLGRRPLPARGPDEEALRLLEQQFIRGEIGPREFAERRRALLRR